MTSLPNQTILEAILTEATCGEACWSAREEVCRCSCGGRNHGCLRTKDGVQPTRTSKQQGIRCELKAVGTYCEIDQKAKEINRASGIKSVIGFLADYYGSSYSTSPEFRKLPAKMRRATETQASKWPELKGLNRRDAWLLWVAVNDGAVKN